MFICFCSSLLLHAQVTDSVAAPDAAVADTTFNYNQGTENNTETDLDKRVHELSKFAQKQQQSIPGERHLPDSAAAELKKDKDYWYANREVGKEKTETGQSNTGKGKKSGDSISGFLASPVFYYIFWIVLAGAFVLLLVIYLRTFTAKGRAIRAAQTAETGIDENIFTIDFEGQLKAAADAGNYRLATRLLFLRLLRSMSERSIIAYSNDKTNMDYLFELGNTQYSRDFMQASKTYEFVWYGNFTISQPQYLTIRQMLDDIQLKVTA